MSVILETTAGDIVIDLLVDYAPKMCENFLKLCKIKYYNFSPIHSIQKSFSCQTGDPLGPLAPSSDGGSSIWGLLEGKDSTFPALFHPKLKHRERGTVSMATAPHPSDPETRLAGSQFLITLGEDGIDFLDDKAAIFGKVAEGFDVLEKINEAIVDERGNPLVDIRIKHTIVLEDPYPDPPGLREPSSSPPPTKAQLETVRIAEGEELVDVEQDEAAAAEAERRKREREAAAQALTLEMLGDLPFAEVKPPENVLFVCKLNPVTTDEDLELIFSRFGKILSCEVIRDQKTGDSLQYAFIEFEDKKSCEEAYYKMDSVLIDDRRIHVDFSQSVSRLSEVWRNDTNTKRKNAAVKKGKGGWGGVKELEKWRKYRNEDVERDDEDDQYRMVHGVEDMHHGRHDTGVTSSSSYNNNNNQKPYDRRAGESRSSGPSGSGAREDSRGGAAGHRRGEGSPDRRTDKYSSSGNNNRPEYRRGHTERRSRSPRRDHGYHRDSYRDNSRHDRPGDPGQSSFRGREDRDWAREDRRDQDRDRRDRSRDRDRDRGQGREKPEKDRYRGRDGRGEYSGR
ncbi:putative peptidyl-prolyl cis-trans isomerase-like 4 [Triangularia verruculosa]|uniref:Peptidyl-prolyl cis-trans isomerase n=1 Tax=Triangularia verruculosa TaxID=2587418 RepID=A0AAN6XIJ9_9PEZI|nr:putative peptidyl-prolyl cis-trans isomerase-like 4 [Triangularia verruculosa]